MHEYAFDIKMAAVVRVRARNADDAEAALLDCLGCAELNVKLSTGFAETAITEASICIDDAEFPFLFEVDNVPVADRDGDLDEDED